jgi:S-methylmethionine-dependent homocysteine/selenocysteine methylase
MSEPVPSLPQLDGGLFLTDGGIETTLIFHHGFELPCFAAFKLLDEERGREALRQYFRSHLAVAARLQMGFILESATWRASADWGDKVGYSPDALAGANRQAVLLLHELKREFEGHRFPMVVSGCVGPRGDGYQAGRPMTEHEAEDYHSAQIRALCEAGVDLITAMTMTNLAEAIGVARAARACGKPVAISFTTETNGRLPAGQALREAIERMDEATGGTPAYYMINCAHPTHFDPVLRADEPWTQRIRGLRANASTKSHAELDEATELDAGNPAELGMQYRELRRRFPQLTVLGGCCGTDHRHIAAIGEACAG